MAIYHTESEISKDGTLIIKQIPLPPGHKVEISVKDKTQTKKRNQKYSLKNSVIKYEDPFNGVATDEWENIK